MERNEEEAGRIKAVFDLMPSDWDTRPMTIANEIRTFLGSIKDEGTSIDSGGGDGCADLFVTIDKVEYMVSVKSPPKLS